LNLFRTLWNVVLKAVVYLEFQINEVHQLVISISLCWYYWL